jgi:hypothetical protein
MYSENHWDIKHVGRGSRVRGKGGVAVQSFSVVELAEGFRLSISVASGEAIRILLSLLLAVPWLRRLAAGLPPRRPGFDPGPVRVGFVVDKVVLGQVLPPSTSVFPC